ncbi:MAG: hypothetical protein IT365_21165 [Candidatus Hydrogenedentes bacterium]|nr:hypothetical protein [Candidatus Hydrogenedentota bacterium]
MIQSLPLFVFLVMLAFLIAMAGICVFAGLHARRRAALIKAMPTSQIGSAEDGYREFEGTIEAIDGQTLSAPLTLSPCCWYHARVEKWVPRRGSSETSRWETVREITSSSPFLLRDATGVCAVYPDGAEVTPTDKSLWYGASQEPSDRSPKRVGPGESAKGMLEIACGPNSRYRYFEERMYDGDPLLVLGHFSRMHEEDATDEDDEPLDSDADDSLDDHSEEGERDAESFSELAKQVTANSISSGARTHPFILSTTPQAAHVAISELGGLGALFIALVPLAIAAYLIWCRYG